MSANTYNAYDMHKQWQLTKPIEPTASKRSLIQTIYVA